MTDARPGGSPAPRPTGWIDRSLTWIEVAGNKLPDPAMLFVIALLLTWVLSALPGGRELHRDRPADRRAHPGQQPAHGHGPRAASSRPWCGRSRAFPPLGVVLVALLGVGVAEHTGFIGAEPEGHARAHAASAADADADPRGVRQPHGGRRRLRARDSARRRDLLRGGPPSAGRHRGGVRRRLGRVQRQLHSLGHRPAAAGLHPVGRADHRSRSRMVNPLCNWAFTSASSLPRHRSRLVHHRSRSSSHACRRTTPVDGDTADMPTHGAARRRRSAAGCVGLADDGGGIGCCWPRCGVARHDSPLRSPDGRAHGVHRRR